MAIQSAPNDAGEVVKVTEAGLTYVAVDENRNKRPVPSI
jgi:acyl-CoA hydrolase